MNPDVVNSLNPERVGTVIALLTLIVILVRVVQTRKWVPGVYYEDMRTERDMARNEAKASGTLLASATDSIATMTESMKTLADAHARVTEHLSTPPKGGSR